jgi:hypothetical protein
MKLCVVAGCPHQHEAKGYCAKHYKRVKRTGQTELRNKRNTFYSKDLKSVGMGPMTQRGIFNLFRALP